MITIKELRDLAVHAVKRTAPENYTVENIDSAFAGALNEIAGSINKFNKSKYDIFEIMIEQIDSAVPNKVIDALSVFADVQQVGQNQKAVFKRRVGKNRARKFLTQVGVSGVYETFRLDNTSFTVEPKAVGGAVTIDFERMLDGAESLPDVLQVVQEGLVDAVYNEVQKALIAAASVTSAPAANRVIDSSFNAAHMVNLINIAKAYGGSAVIWAPPEFISAMGPDAIVPGTSNYAGVYSPDDIESIHMNGKIRIFRGTPVVEIPQSYTDDSNTTTWINPQYAYILPTGGEKVVKVVLEGATQMWDRINADQSIEINAYKKLGVAILAYNNWCIYRNTGISDTTGFPYGV